LACAYSTTANSVLSLVSSYFIKSPTSVGKLVFTQDGVPTWEVRHKTKNVNGSADDLIACGAAADTFQAAKAAGLFEQKDAVP
jgi:hypothetical protein